MKIITVKSRTALLLVVALLTLVLLLPSCTIQKRLYRPGYHIETVRGGDKKTTRPVESVEAIAVAEEQVNDADVKAAKQVNDAGIAAEEQTADAGFATEVKVPAIPNPTEEPNTTAIKTMQHVKKAAGSIKKQYGVQALKKNAATYTKEEKYRRFSPEFWAVVGIVGLVLLLSTLTYVLNSPLLIAYVLVIGYYVVQILLSLLVLGAIIYGIWWLFTEF